MHRLKVFVIHQNPLNTGLLLCDEHLPRFRVFGSGLAHRGRGVLKRPLPIANQAIALLRINPVFVLDLGLREYNFDLKQAIVRMAGKLTIRLFAGAPNRVRDGHHLSGEKYRGVADGAGMMLKGGVRCLAGFINDGNVVNRFEPCRSRVVADFLQVVAGETPVVKVEPYSVPVKRDRRPELELLCRPGPPGKLALLALDRILGRPVRDLSEIRVHTGSDLIHLRDGVATAYARQQNKLVS